MAGRRIRDAADAQACLAEVAKSGQSLASWARAQKVDGRSLTAWSINLSKQVGEAEEAAPVRLVELVAQTERPRTRYTLRLGVVTLELDDQFDDATLRRLIEVVSSCSV